MVKQVQKDLEALVNVLKGHWIQGAMCDGPADGVCYCLAGAATKVVFDNAHGYPYISQIVKPTDAKERRFSTLIKALSSVLPLKSRNHSTIKDAGFSSLIDWNDKRGRTERGVLALVKRAQAAVA